MTYKKAYQTITAFAFCLVVGISAVSAEEVKVLTADEIKKAFIGNTLDHAKVWAFWAPDGTLRAKSKRGATETGKYSISANGIYCRAWTNWRGGKEQCGKIGKVGDEYARIVGGEVQSTFKIMKGNPKGL